MRNTKLILAMLAGCMVMSGAAFAQDAPPKAEKTATPTQTSSDSMKSGDSSMKTSDSMKSGDSMKSDDSMKSGASDGTMKSTHKKTHKKAATGDTSAPAKSSSSGM